jgi:hypothetical protein
MRGQSPALSNGVNLPTQRAYLHTPLQGGKKLFQIVELLDLRRFVSPPRTPLLPAPKDGASSKKAILIPHSSLASWSNGVNPKPRKTLIPDFCTA